MINERANMQEARLLSFILYSESVIPFPVYVQFDLQEHFHPPHISSSSSSSMRGFCPPQCQRPYVTQNMASLHGSPQWLHPTDSMIAMTARSPHTHTALYLRGRSLTSDTSWLLTHIESWSRARTARCRSEGLTVVIFVPFNQEYIVTHHLIISHSCFFYTFPQNWVLKADVTMLVGARWS